MPLSIDDYETVRFLGQGGFGECHLVRKKQDNTLVVIKKINYSWMDDKSKEMIVGEVNILRQLNHPNILKYLGRSVKKDIQTLFIFTEYCEGGDLGKLVASRRLARQIIEEDFIWKMFCQLTNALDYCHNESPCGKTILHRDIKPQNVFLTKNNDAILGDFGISRTLSLTSRYAQTIIGTYYYMSPEILNNCGYDDKSDVWSLGCLIYELCCLRTPFVATTTEQLLKQIKSGKLVPIPHQYSQKLSKVIGMMLTVNPVKRVAIRELLSAAFLQNVYENNGYKIVQKNLLTADSNNNKKPTSPRTPKRQEAPSTNVRKPVQSKNKSAPKEKDSAKKGNELKESAKSSENIKSRINNYAQLCEHLPAQSTNCQRPKGIASDYKSVGSRSVSAQRRVHFNLGESHASLQPRLSTTHDNEKENVPQTSRAAIDRRQLRIIRHRLEKAQEKALRLRIAEINTRTH